MIHALHRCSSQTAAINEGINLNSCMSLSAAILFHNNGTLMLLQPV